MQSGMIRSGEGVPGPDFCIWGRSSFDPKDSAEKECGPFPSLFSSKVFEQKEWEGGQKENKPVQGRHPGPAYSLLLNKVRKGRRSLRPVCHNRPSMVPTIRLPGFPLHVETRNCSKLHGRSKSVYWHSRVAGSAGYSPGKRIPGIGPDIK